jgi:hypothetical protein
MSFKEKTNIFGSHSTIMPSRFVYYSGKVQSAERNGQVEEKDATLKFWIT